jgi:protein ImuB
VYLQKKLSAQKFTAKWWLQQGQHRDYYGVEDEEGKRYWIFGLGFYDGKESAWFVYGFFA